MKLTQRDKMENNLIDEVFKCEILERITLMNLNEIIAISEGIVLTPELNTDVNIHGGCCADLMSDVLAYSRPRAVLITGLTNPQVVRTAQMADFRAIVFIRGKKPQSETIEIALQENIPLISSPLGMFEISAKLHDAGLKSYESNGTN
jgi:predicted transcriptional regulator